MDLFKDHLQVLSERLHLNALKDPWNPSKNLKNSHSNLERPQTLKCMCMTVREGQQNENKDRWVKIPFASHHLLNSVQLNDAVRSVQSDQSELNKTKLRF